MQKYKETIAFWVLLGSIVLLAGCMEIGRPFDEPLNSSVSGQETNTAPLKRFQDTSLNDSPTAVDSAIELSNKYAALSEETAKLKLERQHLINENRVLQEKVAAMEPEFTQVKKELTQANDLLIEMRLELNNWKANVLGFRDEMRQADNAQLEALVKILEILGGEVQDISIEQNTDPGTVE